MINSNLTVLRFLKFFAVSSGQFVESAYLICLISVYVNNKIKTAYVNNAANISNHEMYLLNNLLCCCCRKRSTRIKWSWWWWITCIQSLAVQMDTFVLGYVNTSFLHDMFSVKGGMWDGIMCNNVLTALQSCGKCHWR